MRVVFVTHQYPPHYNTGTELYAKRLALKLRGHLGLDVRVFTFEPAYRGDGQLLRCEDTEDAGVPVTRLWYWPGLFPNRPLAQYYNVFAAKEFRKYLQRVRPAVVHFFHTAFLGAALLEETYLARVPMLVNLMDSWFLCPTAQLLRRRTQQDCPGPELMECIDCLAAGDADYGRLRTFGGVIGFQPPYPETLHKTGSMRLANGSMHAQLEAVMARPAFLRRTLALADRIVSPSYALRDIFAASGYRTERFSVVRYGVEPTPAYAFDRQADPRLRLGFIGSINRPKGLHLLIEALAGLPGDLSLDIFGNPAHFPEYAEECIAKARQDSRIRIRGPMRPEDAPLALRDIDVLVVPSIWHENTPFVVLEGCAAGVPVVGADVSGIAELIEDGRNGRLFRVGDATSLRQVLQELLDDRAQVARLSCHFAGIRTLLANAREFAAMYHQLAHATAVVPTAQGGPGVVAIGAVEGDGHGQ